MEQILSQQREFLRDLSPFLIHIGVFFLQKKDNYQKNLIFVKSSFMNFDSVITMRKCIYVFSLLLVCSLTYGQRLLTFKASDGLEVTADFYETFAESNKYMLMFHQADYSRGEFQQIASRIIKLDINCVAVDLRYGNEVNYINNETAMRARLSGHAISMMDCEKDILAAIEHVYAMDSSAKIFLMGSSFSASLCLKVAKDRKDIQAVIAYSPGEFFSDFSMANYLKGLNTPTYIACPRSEYSYVSQLADGITSSKSVLFRPESSGGMHGARCLWWNSDSSEEFWLSLLFFLKDFK